MKFRTITLATVVVSLAISIAFLAFTTLNRDANGQKENRNRVTKLPEVVSKISTLEIINVSLQGAETQSPSVVIEIKNKSDKSIIGIAIESGDEKDASGTTLNGFNEGDEPPIEILKPHATIKANFPLANVQPGFPVKIVGVMYVDGTENGEKTALDTMRRQREHYKNKKKGQASPQ